MKKKEKVKNFLKIEKKIFLVYQLEKGDSGTEHYQGYVIFKSLKSMRQVKVLFPRAHLEKARGSSAQNIKYCTKEEGREDGPWEFGTRPDPGRRTDLESVARQAQEEGMAAVEDAHVGMVVRYYKGLQHVVNSSRARKRRREGFRKIKVRCYFGSTETGKSRHCYDKYPGLYEVVTNSNGGSYWFDGYEGEDVILFDDFRGSSCKLHEMLRYLDGYARQVPVKGGFVWLNHSVVLITTNEHPSEWYFKGDPDREQKLAPLLSRLGVGGSGGRDGRIVFFPKDAPVPASSSSSSASTLSVSAQLAVPSYSTFEERCPLLD